MIAACASTSFSASRHTRAMAATVSTGNWPTADSADSMTASVPSITALATSDTSARVCLEAEKEVLAHAIGQDTAYVPPITQAEMAISHAVVFTARHLGVKAIAALTASGTTARYMSAMDVAVPIYAMSPSEETQRKVTLLKGVHPVSFEHGRDPEEVLHQAEACLKALGAVSNGDLILLTIGEPIGKPGGTNTMKIIKIGAHD